MCYTKATILITLSVGAHSFNIWSHCMGTCAALIQDVTHTINLHFHTLREYYDPSQYLKVTADKLQGKEISDL